MNRRTRRRAAVLASLAAACWACSGPALRTRLAPPAFCGEVKVATEGLDPVSPARSFHASAERVVLHVSLSNVMDPHTLRVRWNDPFGRLYLDTGAIPVNAAGGFARRLDFASTLPVASAGASLLAGTWGAVLLYDERPVWEGEFRIQED